MDSSVVHLENQALRSKLDKRKKIYKSVKSVEVNTLAFEEKSSKLESENEGLLREVQKAKEEVDAFRDLNSKFMCRIKELIDDREKLHDQVDSLSFAANAAKCELETYKESNTDWKQEYKLKESVCEGLVHQLDLLEQVKDELERTKKNAEDMKIAKEVAEVNIAARDNYTEGLEKKLKLAQTKQKETEEETKVLKSKVEKAEKELIDSITAVKSLEKNDDIQGGMITELSKKLKCHVQMIRQLQRSGPGVCLLYTSPSPRDGLLSRMPSSA